MKRCLSVIFCLTVFLTIPTSAKKAIDFTLRDLEGNSIHLRDYIGKNVILINFWATWCIPCVKELPHLQNFHDKYKEEGLIVFAITVDSSETEALVRPFIKRYSYNFQVLLDKESRVVALYNPRVIMPYTVLIDRTGKIRHVHQGYSPGDEKSLEENVISLLEQKETEEEKSDSLYINESFLNRNFSDKDYVDRQREGRASQIINQLDISFTTGDYLAGIRLDANLDFSPWQDRFSLAKRFFEVNKRDFSLRLGDFYHSMGRGLLFSVLKTFEKEGLEYIIDTTVDGGKFSYAHKQISAEIFGGWLSREQTDLDDKVYGGTLGWRIKTLADIKVNFLGASLEPGSSFNNKTVTMESLTLDLPNISDFAKVYGEFMLIQKKQHYKEGQIEGHGLYLESSFILNNMTLLFEFKDYKNLDFEYSRAPLLESETLPILANQFAKDTTDISGLAGRIDYYFPKISTLLYGKAAYFDDFSKKEPRHIFHFFAGLEKSFKETGWLSVLGGYRVEDTSSLIFYYTHGDTLHYQFNLSYPLNSRLSLEFDLKGKKFDGTHFNYFERRSYLSFHYSQRWIVTVFFDRTDDPEILFFKDKKNWWGIQLEIKVSHANFIRIFYGANKGGVKCSGGVCKFFPPFEGLRIDSVFRF